MDKGPEGVVGAGMAHLSIVDLSDHVFELILRRLDDRSLARSCCVNSKFRRAASSNQLWQALSCRRWAHCRSHLFPDESSTHQIGDVTAWQRLYREENGLRHPASFATHKIDINHESNFIEAVHITQHDYGYPQGSTRLYMATDNAIQEWMLDADSPDAAPSATLSARCPLESSQSYCSILKLPQKVLCAGQLPAELIDDCFMTHRSLSVTTPI